MESIGTLAGGIAHDLNNVLSPILMAIDMLQLKATDEASKKWLDVLRTNAERGGDMVRQVLSFARRRRRASCLATEAPHKRDSQDPA